MESVAMNAARWVVGKALSLLSGGFVEAWAASTELGANVGAIKMELLYAQGMLDNARGRETRSLALKQLLLELRGLAYDAEDVLDELDYFRIQDELDGTYEAAEEHAKGCLHGLVLNTRHTARHVASKFGLSSHVDAATAAEADSPQDNTKKGCLSAAFSCTAAAAAMDDRSDHTPGQNNMKGCLSAALPCGGGDQASCKLSSSPLPSHSSDDDDKAAAGNGCMQKIKSSARGTIHLVGKRLGCLSFAAEGDNADESSTINLRTKGIRFLCCPCPCRESQKVDAMKTTKLKFNRVDLSRRMKNIFEQLKPVCAKVSTILNLELLESTNRNISQCIAMSLNAEFSRKPRHAPVLPSSVAISRPMTTSEFTDLEFYGRMSERIKTINDITQGDYCDKELTVIPIVGPGGIGKTTFTQHIYKQVESQFDVEVWLCVSLNFNVYRLKEEIAKLIPKLKGEKSGGPDDLIEQRLKSKKFLLVLDDMWDCGNGDEWKRLLAPLRRVQTKGNIIIVTTRFLAVAEMVKTIEHPIQLEGLESEVFWKLFQQCVFGDHKTINNHAHLQETGKLIAKKLKGSPLAAKTVGRLLRNHLDLDHWTSVLESKEWEIQTGENDIMPALKLSYDYLPFHLQQCFIYCALFPEDYKFDSDELIHVWIGLDILQSQHDQNKRTEDIGLSYLNDLVDYGFFKKDVNKDGSPYYIMHDLLHELALKVSSYECLAITSSNVKAIQIPPSIRHLSIVIDAMDVSDIATFENVKKDFSTLNKRLDVEKLRSLMLFGQYHGSFVIPFGNLLSKAKALRVILLSTLSYDVENMLHNFSELVHLRYLRIMEGFSQNESMPSIISRFYHLRILDVQHCNGFFRLPRNINNLVRLRHCLVPYDTLHSGIANVEKLKCLQELRRFEVKSQVDAFALRQLGQLEGLKGSLGIHNLENSETAEEAKLLHKSHIHKLILEWDFHRSTIDPSREEHVLESLKPHSNLHELHIIGHGGITCPSWLGANLSIKGLQHLHLNYVNWNKFPPIGELWLVDEYGKESLGSTEGQSFHNLKRLELVDMPKLAKWSGNDAYYVFSLLEVLIVDDCPNLMELPFTHSTWPEQEMNLNQFPTLKKLVIAKCPRLSSLPPLPWTSSPCSALIEEVGSDFHRLDYSESDQSEPRLEIEGNDGLLGSTFWKVLALSNLTELKELVMTKCPPLPLEHLQMLSSLRRLSINDSGSVLQPVEGENTVTYQFPVEQLEISNCSATGTELTHMLSYFPKLSDLEIKNCENITGLGVMDQELTATSTLSPPSPSGKKLEDAHLGQEQRQARGEDEVSVAVAGLLLLPSQLQLLTILECSGLIVQVGSLGDDMEEGLRAVRGGLKGLSSLQSLSIQDCPNFFSYSSSLSCFPFPPSLQNLYLGGARGMETLAPLSNLNSLTRLHIKDCGDLRGEGLSSVLDYGHLIELNVFNTPKFSIGPNPSRLQHMDTDDMAGILLVPICRALSSSLTTLIFNFVNEVERLTKEQNAALQLLSSLQVLIFWDFPKLQSLPDGLQRLVSLRRLEILFCPAIRSLPKGGLPRSLQALDVADSESKELIRQCRKLKGTIPIIKDQYYLQGPWMSIRRPYYSFFESMHNIELICMKTST